MPYGLQQNTIQEINRIFANYENIDEAILDGSRAKGNYTPGSDIDLTVIVILTISFCRTRLTSQFFSKYQILI